MGTYNPFEPATLGNLKLKNRFMKAVDFDAVENHIGHGYGLSQFITQCNYCVPLIQHPEGIRCVLNEDVAA